jgi:hypothetical protein
MAGCQPCGSGRLKRAPLIFGDAIVHSFSRKRRYRCASCGRTSWHHRLKRRTETPSTGQRRAPDGRAIWFAVSVIVLLLVAAVLLVSTVEPSHSVPPDAGPSGRTEQSIAPPDRVGAALTMRRLAICWAALPRGRYDLGRKWQTVSIMFFSVLRWKS